MIKKNQVVVVNVVSESLVCERIFTSTNKMNNFLKFVNKNVFTKEKCEVKIETKQIN
jgi:hypothetical protein